MATICVDVGTSLIKTVAFDDGGKEIALARRETEVLRPAPGPAILWNDARAAAIVDRWRAAGVLKEAFRRNGSQTFSGLPKGIFTWLKQHDPDRLEGSSKSLCCNGWIFYNLTGRMVIDESDAAVPFFDIRERRYSPELLKLYDLEWAERLLPEVLSNDRRVGELRSAAAAELGLSAGLPVV